MNDKLKEALNWAHELNRNTPFQRELDIDRVKTLARGVHEAVSDFKASLIPDDARVREAMEYASKCAAAIEDFRGMGGDKEVVVLSEALMNAQAELVAERERAAKVVEAAKHCLPRRGRDLGVALAAYDKDRV